MKKFYLALMAVAAITLTGCREKDESAEPGPTDPPAPSVLRPADIVGRGYDATQEYAKEDYVAAPVLSIPKLKAAGLMADVVEPRTSMTTELYGTTLEDYHQKLSGKLGMKGDAFGFFATCNGRFSITSTDKYTYGYMTGRYCYKRYIYKIKASPISDLIPCLSDEFLADVEHLSTEDLVKRYGTHVINGLSTGGVIEYNISAKRSSEEKVDDFGADLVLGFKNKISVQRSGEAQRFAEFKKKHSECAERTLCRGGDSYLVIASSDSVCIESSILDAWCKSLANDSKSVMVDFEGPGDGSLTPLYEFIEDAAKKEQVRNYILRRMANPWMTKDSEYLIVCLRKVTSCFYGVARHAWYQFNLAVDGPADQSDNLFNTYSTDASVTGGGLEKNCLWFLSATSEGGTRVLDFMDKKTVSNMWVSKAYKDSYFRWEPVPHSVIFTVPARGNSTFTLSIDKLNTHWGFAKTSDKITFTKPEGSNQWFYTNSSKDICYIVDYKKAKDDQERFFNWRFYFKDRPQHWLELQFEIANDTIQ